MPTRAFEVDAVEYPFKDSWLVEEGDGGALHIVDHVKDQPFCCSTGTLQEDCSEGIAYAVCGLAQNRGARQ